MTLFYGHKPRVVLDIDNSKIGNAIQIDNINVSQAFYGKLYNNTSYYYLDEREQFNLYMDISTPYKLTKKQSDSFTIDIYKISNKDMSKIYSFNPQTLSWQYFYEEYGGDYYYQTKVTDIVLDSGQYIIKLNNPSYSGKYVLAVGKIEEFTILDSINAIYNIYLVKTKFFNKKWTSLSESKIIRIVIIIFIIILIVICLLLLFYKKLI